MWFVDTSVLVPVFIPGHIHHEPSFKVFVRADPKSPACAAHSLAEVYATITRLPGKHRTSGEQALIFLEMIEERFSFVTLNTAEYLDSIRETAALGITGATTYDGLIAACARKAKANVLYTWNVRDFSRLAMRQPARPARPS
jgi:predicted nucleic acid-binding protein